VFDHESHDLSLFFFCVSFKRARFCFKEKTQHPQKVKRAPALRPGRFAPWKNASGTE
jgi:hypothetical protein